MTSYMWIVLFATFVFATGQDFDLGDALGDDVTPKPEVKPPKKDGDLDLSDALNPDLPSEPKKPTKTGGDLDLLDGLDDAKKPAPPSGGGGGGFSDSDLSDVAGNDEYNPDGGKGRIGGGSSDSTGDTSGETPAQSGAMAGIVSAVGVAILGAASSFFAYQKKKLCFKIQGGQDPESGTNQPGTQFDPQAFSNLLKSS